VVAANDISVDIFVNSGPAQAHDSLLETVDLGTFDPGAYVYTVVLHPARKGGWGTLTVSGSFRVTCAPGPLCQESDVCLLLPDPGPCDGVCPRVFYNASTGQCESFVYGCCGGNANNFLTTEECQAACGSPIPAVSTWGLLVTMFLLLIAGTVAIQTRTSFGSSGNSGKRKRDRRGPGLPGACAPEPTGPASWVAGSVPHTESVSRLNVASGLVPGAGRQGQSCAAHKGRRYS
jgi:hypothetical protein